jgi:hypothetical protein
VKKAIIIVLLIGTTVIRLQPANAQIPVVSLVTGVIKKVITALDLKVQQLQNQTISLQNAEQGLENNLHLNSLTDISGWLNKEKNLYQDYYQDLAKVKTIILDYDEVKRIVNQQVELVSEYKSAYALFQRDKHFSTGEIGYMSNIYNGILQESIRNLDEVLLAVNSFSMQMSDFERLQMVHKASGGMQKNLDDLRQFNSGNIRLSLDRARDAQDRQTVTQLYGIR